MTQFKTPGVFVQEISKLPPSVAPVATAIPAFLGYTERATRLVAGDLDLVPTRITSLVEYEELFGAGPPAVLTSVDLGGDNNVISHNLSQTFYLYDSLRLYFKNGGGPCWIVSVGDYNVATPGSSDYTPGYAALKRVDEPTLIVTPDAAGFDKTNLGTVQRDALAQCADLQDRFTIMDTNDPGASGNTLTTVRNDFRNEIGSKNLNYGACYTPWLNSNLPKNIRYRDIKGKVRQFGSPVDFKDFTTDTTVEDLIDDLNQTVTDNDTISTDITGVALPETTLLAKYEDTLGDFRSAASYATRLARFRDLIKASFDISDSLLDKWGDATTGLTGPLKTDVQNVMTSLVATLTELIEFDKALVDDLAGDKKIVNTAYATLVPTYTFPAWLAIPAPTGIFLPGIVHAVPTSNAQRETNMLAVESEVTRIFFDFLNSVESIIQTGNDLELTLDLSLRNSLQVFKNIFAVLNTALTTLPASGAVAGIYAATDRTRGVWKAPANVSLDNVVALTEMIDKDEQADLNVDATAGKSINAIRFFSGKGFLVWGARTLAGNDNEWRYINVRRLFIFIEESVKKAMEPVVFEANDASTWNRVKGTIGNFLTSLWRDGALAGPKPEQAFFVNVGLGETMTNQDILEGRLITEIGIAAVRPAEFIILKFSHKLQEV